MYSVIYYICEMLFYVLHELFIIIKYHFVYMLNEFQSHTTGVFAPLEGFRAQMVK